MQDKQFFDYFYAENYH